MSENREQASLEVSEFVTSVERSWAERGMAPAQRRRLTGELERDLEEAITNAAAIREVMPTDPDDFASELASANGIDLTVMPASEALTARGLVQVGLLGGAVGAVAAWVLVYQGILFVPLYALLDDTNPVSEFAIILALHLTAAAITLAGAIVGIRLRFKDRPEISGALWSLTWMMALAGTASVAPIMGFARLMGYSLAPIVLLVEVGIAALFCGAAIALVARRRLGLRLG